LKLGYSTNAFVKYPLFDAIDLIAKLGFGGVEIMADRPHLYPQDWEPEGLRRLKNLIHEKGLRVTNLNSFTLFAVGDTYLPSWIEPRKERREIRIRHTLECLKLASYLGCGNISVPPGGPLAGMSRKEALALFHEGLEKVIPLAEQLKVKILVEPEPDLLLENTAEYKEFIRGVRSDSVGLNFDIGHFYCAGEDPAEAFQELVPWIGHCHIEDIGHDRIHYHLIPGLGAIDFQRILATIVQSGYEGDITLELYTCADKPVEAGQQGLKHLSVLFREAGFDLDVLLNKGAIEG
jgi:sugar phosphate isomerase/epimerase